MFSTKLIFLCVVCLIALASALPAPVQEHEIENHNVDQPEEHHLDSLDADPEAEHTRVRRWGYGYGGYGGFGGYGYRPWGMGMYRPWGMGYGMGMYRPWGMWGR